MNDDAQASKWTGHTTARVDQELFLRNEYLAADNRILFAKIKRRGVSRLPAVAISFWCTWVCLRGTGVFIVEVLTLKGLMTYSVLFFIKLERWRVCLAGIPPYPNQLWIEQQARNVTMKDWGFLGHSRYLLHDRDGQFSPGFREVIKGGELRPLKLPARSPNLNAFAKRWVRSVKY